MRIHNAIIIIMLMLFPHLVFGQEQGNEALSFQRYKALIDSIAKDTAQLVKEIDTLSKQLAIKREWIKELTSDADINNNKKLFDSLSNIYFKQVAGDKVTDNNAEKQNAKNMGQRNEPTQNSQKGQQQTAEDKTAKTNDNKSSDSPTIVIILSCIFALVSTAALYLFQKLRKSKMENDELTKEKDNLTKEKDNLTNEKDNLNKGIQDLNNNMQGLKNEIETLKKENENLKQNVQVRKPEPPTPPVATPPKVVDDGRTRCCTILPNVVGISYQGDSHINSKTPCQDYHLYVNVNAAWNVGIVSDGAGSKKKSNQGSEFICEFFAKKLTEYFSDTKYSHGNIPDKDIWDNDLRKLLIEYQKTLFQEKNCKSYEEFDSYGSTLIMLAYSPNGYVTAHVGDGRAGVARKVKGEDGQISLKWESIMTPHKGEEANQTVFCTSTNFEKHPDLTLSNVPVPETRVSSEPIHAFALMSDGCEAAAWVMQQRKEIPEENDFVLIDVNKPRAGVLNTLLNAINAGAKQSDLEAFVTTRFPKMETEPDDKTILAGIVR